MKTIKWQWTIMRRDDEAVVGCDLGWFETDEDGVREPCLVDSRWQARYERNEMPDHLRDEHVVAKARRLDDGSIAVEVGGRYGVLTFHPSCWE